MFGYNPYGTYSGPYGFGRASPSYSSPDADYLRALAQERAAQEQLLAARRAQEEARQRAERTRISRQGNGIPLQYSPVYDLDDYEDHDSYDGGFMPYGGFGGYSPSTRQRRAMVEQERQRVLQRELERREQERELERLRFEEEKRQLEEERKRLMEEERRQRLRAEELMRREQEYNRQRANQFNPLFGGYDWTPEEDDMMSPHAGRRSHTFRPTDRRGTASQGTPAMPYPKPNGSALRSSSVPPRSAAPPSPIRPSASNNAKSGHFKIPIRTPSPKVKASSPKPQATPEQHVAARKIQEAYRAHAARTSALRAIDEYRAKFEHLKAGFRFPLTLDFAAAPGSHDFVSVPVDPAALAALVLADGVSVEEGRNRRPHLAYTPRNAPIHGYLEELNQLLGKLDAVESGGDKEVREKRKGIVREVEAEAERVEAVIGEVWAKWQARQTEQTVTVAPSTSAATPEPPTADQRDEKRMDIEPESVPTPEVDIADAEAEEEPAVREETQEALTSPPVIESVPSPEVEIPDAEPEKESGYENDSEEVGGRQDGSSVPDAVESAPTPEVDIKDADEEVTTRRSSPVESPEPVRVSPVHVHSQFSAAVEPTPRSPLTEQLMPEVALIEMCPVTAGESSTSVAHQDDYPVTPTLSSSQDNAESEDEGPGTPLMGLAPNIFVTPAVEQEVGRGDFESKEPESENKVDADAARELKMARERELF